MTTTRTLDLIEDKCGTAEELINATRMAAQSDTPDWADAIDAAEKAVQTATSMLRSVLLAARDDGASWEQVGAMLKVSRQSAHERFGPGPAALLP